MPPLISLLLPTRARPDLACRFLESAFVTCRHPDRVEIIMVVDNDDASYDGFESPFERTLLFSIAPLNMSGYNRFAADRSSGDILVLVNDDIVVESKEWDVAIRDMHAGYPDEVYLSFPNDGFKKSKLSTFPILSRFTYQSFDVLPAIYAGAFIDTHLHEIFLNLQALGEGRICYLADVNFTHHHFRVTKEVPDETYTRRDRFGDDQVFLRHVRNRHYVSVEMKDYLRTGDLNKSPSSTGAFEGSMAAYSYYLFACPGHLSYRLRVIGYLFARLIYNQFSNWHQYGAASRKTP